ncbi:MAG: RNA ligase (ATP) [Peptococcaceae bacterium]|nr:RNA ligase (ATP) [Peptococcaceae bacterium]
MARKLASIQIIKDIHPIPDADVIEVVSILGWKVVGKKGEFSAGDTCVYFEVDSFLPIDQRFEFLRGTSYKRNDFMGEGFRLKTIRLRGQISQGLALPLDVFPEITSAHQEIDTDVTELLGVKKWEIPEVQGTFGTSCGAFPSWVSKTDETRLQSVLEVLDEIAGKPYYISTKMDGTSVSMGRRDGEFWVAGRNIRYADDGKASAWQMAHNLGLPDKAKTWDKDYTIQGEFCGQGIQKNPLKLFNPEWYIFNVIDPETHIRLSLSKMLTFCEANGLQPIPIEEKGEKFPYKTVDEMLERAEGQYASGSTKEGIVIRSIEPMYSPVLRSDMSFKVINNKYLLKQKD